MGSDRSILTYWDLVVLAFRAGWRFMVSVLVVIAMAAICIHHADRDVQRDLRIAQLEAEAAACQGIRDLADSIDATPSGSRTEAGAILAGR